MHVMNVASPAVLVHATSINSLDKPEGSLCARAGCMRIRLYGWALARWAHCLRRHHLHRLFGRGELRGGGDEVSCHGSGAGAAPARLAE
jgi:hypothetical protein